MEYKKPSPADCCHSLEHAHTGRISTLHTSSLDLEKYLAWNRAHHSMDYMPTNQNM